MRTPEDDQIFEIQAKTRLDQTRLNPPDCICHFICKSVFSLVENAMHSWDHLSHSSVCSENSVIIKQQTTDKVCSVWCLHHGPPHLFFWFMCVHQCKGWVCCIKMIDKYILRHWYNHSHCFETAEPITVKLSIEPSSYRNGFTLSGWQCKTGGASSS